MKRICFLINSDWYFELHWLERALAARDAGYDIHIICHFVSGDIKARLESIGFTCHNSLILAHSLNPLSFMVSSIKVWNIIRKIEPDILHCITIKLCIIGGGYAKIKNKPVILNFAGLGRVFDLNSRSPKFVRWGALVFYKFIFKNKKARLVFEHKKDQKKLVSLTGVDVNRSEVIDGAGINTDLFPYTPESLVKSPSVPTVLFASRMIWSKGLYDLISVKKILKNCGVEFKLNVAGIIIPEDADAMPLSILEQWHREGDINWLGKSNNVCQLIMESNVVALPSNYSEGVPRILLEAASIGRASISYDVGGCESLILDGENGFLIEAKDINAFAVKLKLLLEDPDLRHSMGVAGRKLALNKFSSSIVITKNLNLYNSIMAEN